MASPAEVVASAFAQAQTYASSAQAQLLSFTARLTDAIQTVPLMDVTWTPIPAPSAVTVPTFTPGSDYTSPLLDAATQAITDRLAGGTGLDPAVEAALWDRARERELATMQAGIDSLMADSESLGFVLPPGVIAEGVRLAQRGYYDKTAELSRDIAVKQADLEQGNIQKTIEQAVQLETSTADAVSKRAQVAIEVFRAEVIGFQASVDQNVKQWEIAIKQYEATNTFTFNAQKMNAEIIRANASALLEAGKAGAQVFAQLAASAYGLIHASASVSAGASTSVGYSYSNDTQDSPPAVTSI